MKLFVVLALFIAIAYAFPVEEVDQNQEVESPLTIVAVEDENPDDENSEVVRQKRQFGFGLLGGLGGFGGYNRYPGYYGGYGGYGYHHHRGHHHHHGHRHFGK